MSNVTVGFAVRNMAGRIFLPHHSPSLMERWRRPKVRGKSADDAQLKLYGQVLPGGFLNYGYTEDLGLTPDRMCIADIERAQIRYGERLADLVVERERPVLDSGCGMGGLLGLLLQRGCQPTALTPNRTQIQHVRTVYPNVPVIEGKLEHIPLPQYRHVFGTVITSESFQYVKLDQGLAVLEQILRPGGRWILCDYFRTDTASRRSGHLWSEFVAAVERGGWRIVLQQDITAHVLPTIAFVHMLATRFGLPVAQFAADRLERKRPVLQYVLAGVIAQAREQIQAHLDLVDPAVFVRRKKYMTLVMER